LPTNNQINLNPPKNKFILKDTLRSLKSNLSISRSITIELIIILLIPFFVSACAPDYPKEKVIESIINIAKEEYNLQVEAQQINRTVGVIIPGGDFFEIDSLGRLAFNPEEEKKLNELIFSITRVLYNSDIDIDFYIITLLGEQKGLECSIIGTVDDLKKAWIGSFSPGELSMRRILDVKIESEEDTLDKKKFKEVKWSYFLIKQIQKRIKWKFPEELEVVGNYKENDEFVFLLTLTKDNPKITPFAIQTIARVIDAYKFEDFNRVTVLDIYKGKITAIDKTDLKKYR